MPPEDDPFFCLEYTPDLILRNTNKTDVDML